MLGKITRKNLLYADDGEDKFLILVKDKLLNDITFCGIDGIMKVFMRQETKGYWDAFDDWNVDIKEWVLDTEAGDIITPHGINCQETGPI